MDTEFFFCVACLWRRRKSRDPKRTRITRARPPITPPATAPVGVLELLSRVTVPPATVGVELSLGVTVFPATVGVELMPGVTVVDESVPFWTTRCCSVRDGVEWLPS